MLFYILIFIFVFTLSHILLNHLIYNIPKGRLMELPPVSPNVRESKHNAKDQQQRYIQVGAANRARVVRNNLYLVTFLNLLTILMFVFSMSYYEWIQLQFQVDKKLSKIVWINLLYLYDSNYSIYMTFYQYASTVCLEDQDLCTSILEQLSFVGLFCFIIFIVAHILQFIDVCVVLWKVCRKVPLSSSNFFRQVFVICTCVYGIGIYVFSIAVMNNINNTKYGISLYLSMVTVALLIAVVVYQQYSIRKLIKAELLLQLLERQKQLNQQQSDRYSMSKNSDSFVL